MASQAVRISGHWFVTQSLGSQSSAATQGLELYYYDWDGSMKAVALADYPGKGLVLVGYDPASDQAFDPQTCVADGTCWTTDTIRFQDLDGTRRQARIETYAAPTGTPEFAPTQPVETQPVSFTANGFAPGGAVGPIRYGWQFQKAGCGLPCTTVTDTNGTVTSQPSYYGSVYGATTTSTWPTSGKYSVRLTATDSEGRTAATTFTVDVGGIPATADVNPQDTATTAGAPSTLTGELWHVGRLDTLDVIVTWGDGTRDRSTYGPAVVTLMGSPVQLTTESTKYDALTATHTYTAPGTYQGTVTVTNQAEQTTRTTFTHTVK